MFTLTSLHTQPSSLQLLCHWLSLPVADNYPKPSQIVIFSKKRKWGRAWKDKKAYLCQSKPFRIHVSSLVLHCRPQGETVLQCLSHKLSPNFQFGWWYGGGVDGREGSAGYLISECLICSGLVQNTRWFFDHILMFSKSWLGSGGITGCGLHFCYWNLVVGLLLKKRR